MEMSDSRKFVSESQPGLCTGIISSRTIHIGVSKEIADAQWRDRLETYKTAKFQANLVPREDAEQFVDLLRYMLRIEPQQRPSAEEVLRHPWFADEQGVEP